MRAHRLAPLACLASLLAAGCGDAAVGGGYRGEPLFTVSGWVLLESGTAYLAADAVTRGRLRMAVLWSSQGPRERFDLISSVAERADAAALFPARYELTLYTPPSPALMHLTGDLGDLAIGVIVAFIDSDGDGHWDGAHEQLVGAVVGTAIVYSPEGTQDGSVGAPFPAGYALAHVNADPAICGDLGHAQLIYRDSAEVELRVDMTFPHDAALDLDCDGDPIEWVAFCPPSVAEIRARCVDLAATDAPDPMCGVCQGFLPPQDGSPDHCDWWLGECLRHFPPSDCEVTWAACRGTASAAGCGSSAPCVCRAMHDACVADAVELAECDARFDACMAP